jgi:hypothetical protein
VRDQLGHHSTKVTVDVYGHLVPGSNRDAVDKLDDKPQLPATYPQPEERKTQKSTQLVS